MQRRMVRVDEKKLRYTTLQSLIPAGKRAAFVFSFVTQAEGNGDRVGLCRSRISIWPLAR